MRTKLPARFAMMAKAPGFLAPAEKARRPRASKVTIKEKDLQAMAENLCLSMGIRFFRIPDKLMGFLAHFAPPWVRVFVARYFQGVPDMMLFKRGQAGDNVVRFIEIKTEAGKVSQGQSKWHSGLNIHVCYGWDQTESAILAFQGEAPITPNLPTQKD